MNRAVLPPLLCAILSALLVLQSGLAQAQAQAQDPEALIAEADALYDRWSGPFDFAAYEGRLRRALELWEMALPLVPADQVETKAHVLDRLAQAYFELAEGYITKYAEREPAYEKGKDYALASLRLDPDFVRTEKESFRAALRGAKAIAALFWYGNNLGRWLNYHAMTALTGGTLDVRAAFERSVELDEAYDGGGPHRALAAFLAQVPSFLGGDLEGSKAHFERSIELDGEYLENYVNYAEFYAKAKKDWGLFCSLLKATLTKAQDPAVMAKWPFYNKLAVDRAQTLWQLRAEGERVCK
ncbi:MAG: TRAP transporter TatT component family protein [Candidatus Bipolaricaulia bacterium]